MIKKNALTAKLALTITLATLLVACKSSPISPAKVEDRNTTSGSSSNSNNGGNGANDGSGSNSSSIKEVEIDSNANNGSGSAALRDPNNILSKRNIYFDYDSDAVKSEYRDIVNAHGKYLMANPEATMILQGNADESGTREYNLSLGQRRAVAVKKALNLLGVQDKQIETISYGEEKASQNCSGSACDKDRRVDIVHQGE